MYRYFIFSFATVFLINAHGCSVSEKQSVPLTYKEKRQPLEDKEKAHSYFCTGFYFMLNNNWENAVTNFEKAYQYDPDSESILRHLSKCYYYLKKNEKAIYFLNQLARLKPQEFNVHYTLAILYEITGRQRNAIMEYERALQCKTTNLEYVFLADTLYRLANLYMDAGNMEKGIRCYENMLELNLVNEPEKIYFEVGQKYFEKNEIKKAITYFIKAKESNPELSFAHFYLTLCYDALKDYDMAIQEAKNFLQKAPGNWIMHLALADIYRKTNNNPEQVREIKEARKILEKNIASGSRNPKEYFALCQIYRDQYLTDKAIEVIENMKQLHMDRKTQCDMHFLLANLYYENQQFEKVEDELQRALSLNPDFHEANNFLGYYFVENNQNLDKAIQLIKRALKVQPKNGAYLDSLGWAYYKKAHIECRDDYLPIALQTLQEAIRLSEDPDIYDHLGDVYYSLGRWDKAFGAWKKAESIYKKTNKNNRQLENIRAKFQKINRLISIEKENLQVIANRRETADTP